MKFRDLIETDKLNELNEGTELNEEVLESLQNIVNTLSHAGHIVQTAHWNLRSASFTAIHPWFGETYSALSGMADEVAEQIKIADINLIVNVQCGNTQSSVDEQELFINVQKTLQIVKDSLTVAANDLTLSRVLQNLIDGWIAQIDKMVWFIKASTN